jgi:hypothetical protein
VANTSKPAEATAAAAKIFRIIDRSYQLGGSLIITPKSAALRPEPQKTLEWCPI